MATRNNMLPNVVDAYYTQLLSTGTGNGQFYVQVDTGVFDLVNKITQICLTRRPMPNFGEPDVNNLRRPLRRPLSPFTFD